MQPGVVGSDNSMQACMNSQMIHANTTARSGVYPQRLPPLPLDNGMNGNINPSSAGVLLTAQSTDPRRADMHNNPGFEPDFCDVSHNSD